MAWADYPAENSGEVVVFAGPHSGYGARFAYVDEIVATWHGGEYIELFPYGTDPKDAIEGDAVPYDVFNVWDHERDEPQIARSSEAFAAYMREALIEDEDDGDED